MHVLTNCDGYKDSGITHPSVMAQKALLEEFYTQSGINPLSVDYLEAHGTGMSRSKLLKIANDSKISSKTVSQINY